MEKISEKLLNFLVHNGEHPKSLKVLDEEASTRKYFRVSYEKEDLILCIDENFKKSSENFIEIQGFLKEKNICVPEIIQVIKEENALLLSDEGEFDLTSVRDEKEFADKLKEAMDILLNLQKLTPIESVKSKSFDVEKFTFELNFLLSAYKKFQTNFYFDFPIGFEVIRFLETVNNYLAIYEEKVTCHRDFHSRNLLLNSRGTLSVIDFQDMMMGTPQYDLVSILYDAYRPISKKIRIESFEYFRSLSSHSGKKFKEVFFTQALQRSFKALGTYIFQFNENGKSKYRQSILNCLDNLDEIIELDFFPDSLHLFITGLKDHLKESEAFNV